MNKLKKLSALLLTGVLTISLTGCLGGEPELTVNLSNPDPVNTSSSASGNTDNNSKDNTVVTNNTDNNADTTTPDNSDVASPVAVQSGEAVLYNGQILFREYHPFQIESEAVWGEFSFDSATYGSRAHLCTFNPSDPGSGVKEIVEDPGFGDMYLVNGEELYSQYYTNSEDYSRNYNMVYKTNLSTSKTEDICEGNISGFSPDGKHLAVYNYVTDPYLTHFNIYDTADLKNPSANYTSDKGMVSELIMTTCISSKMITITIYTISNSLDSTERLILWLHAILRMLSKGMLLSPNTMTQLRSMTRAFL